MPAVSWDQINAGSDQVAGQIPIPEVLQPHDALPRSALDIAAAAWRQSNILSSTFYQANAPQLPPAQAGYTPFVPGTLAGYEDFMDYFVGSRSPEETQYRKGVVDNIRDDQSVLAQNKGWGLAARIAAGITDPATLVSMAIPLAAPAAWGSRVARVGATVLGNVAVDTAEEAAFHSTMPRTIGESALNVGAGAILSGIFGTVATRVPKDVFEAMRADLNKELRTIPGATRTVESTASAASISSFQTLEDLTIASGPGRFLAKTLGAISPVNRMMTSPNKLTRQIAMRLMDIPYLVNANLKGVANPVSVENIVRSRINNSRSAFVTDYQNTFTDYMTRTAGEGAKDLRSFGEEVIRAVRNGGQSEIPEAAAMAGRLKAVFDADRQTFKDLGVLPEEFDLVGAESYFPRVYDHAAIAADQNGLEARLRQWYTDNPRLPIGSDELISRVEGAPDAASRFFSEDESTFKGTDAHSIVLRDRTNAEVGRLVYVDRGDNVLQVSRTQLASQWKGKGNGQRMLAELIDHAEKTGATVKSDQVVTADQLKAYWGLRDKGYGIEFADEAKVKDAIANGTELSIPGGVVRSMQSPQLILKILEKEQESAKLALKLAKKTATEGKSVSKEARLRFNRAQRRSDALIENLGELKAQGADVETVTQMESRIARNDERIAKAKQYALDAEHDFGAAQAARGEAGKAVRVGGRAVRKQRDQAAQAERTATSRNALNEKAANPQFREPGEIESAVQETINNILGGVRGMADLSGTMVPGARPLKGRVLNVPDHILEPYLVNDLETVMNGYFHATIPQAEMRKAFGSADLHSEIEEITNTTNAQIARAETSAEKQAIRKQRDKDLELIQAMRDRTLLQVGPRGNTPRWLVRTANIARVVKAYNLTRLLGMQTVSSMSDYGHVISRYGLVKTAAATVKFLTNLNANKLIRSNAKRMGAALDWMFSTRGRSFADIGDEYAGTKVGHYAQWAAHGFTKLSGMATWNSALQAIASSLEQDAIANAVKDLTKLSAFKRGVMASSGIDEDMAKRIAGQFEKYGDHSEGLNMMQTSKWDDAQAAQTVESAVVKAADLLVLNKGHGDLPVMMNDPLVQVLFQFKSFGMASVNRIMIPLAQGLAHKDLAAANGLAAMMGLGALTYVVREWASGREPDLSPQRVISESLNWSGALAFLPDIYDPMAGAVNLPRFSRYTSRTPLESLLGPTYGTATSMYDMTSKLFGPGPTNNPNARTEYTQSDLHRIRQMLPLQNLFYLRRIINAMEGEAGHVTGAKDATNQSFAERIAETKPPEKIK